MIRALVTGGSGDIGSSICRHLAADGYHVIVHANSNPDRASVLVKDLIGQGYSAQAVCFDVTDREATGRAISDLLKVNPIQVVVCNAGVH